MPRTLLAGGGLRPRVLYSGAQGLDVGHRHWGPVTENSARGETDPDLEYVGLDNAMWASDCPHGDSVWPYSHETVEQDFVGIDEPNVRKVPYDNARKLYLAKA